MLDILSVMAVNSVEVVKCFEGYPEEERHPLSFNSEGGGNKRHELVSLEGKSAYS